MSENVIEFSGITKLDIPAETILSNAISAGLTTALVLGRRPDGTLYAASSSADDATNVLLCEEFKHELLANNLGDRA